jgi:hypothetical protein
MHKGHIRAPSAGSHSLKLEGLKQDDQYWICVNITLVEVVRCLLQKFILLLSYLLVEPRSMSTRFFCLSYLF